MGELISILLGSPTTYHLTNPNVKPNDYALIQKSLEQMPEKPLGLVRLNEHPRPTANGFIDFEKPNEIQLYRRGKVFMSRDPFKIAGTVLHENTHLRDGVGRSLPDYEVSARERQLQFLRNAQATGQWHDKRYLRELEGLLKHFQGLQAKQPQQ